MTPLQSTPNGPIFFHFRIKFYIQIANVCSNFKMKFASIGLKLHFCTLSDPIFGGPRQKGSHFWAHIEWPPFATKSCHRMPPTFIFRYSRAAKAIHCAQNVKTVRLCTEFNKSTNNIFLICHILWHFQDGRHWPWEFHMGRKLKHAPISLQIVSNCLSCHKDSKNV